MATTYQQLRDGVRSQKWVNRATVLSAHEEASLTEFLNSAYDYCYTIAPWEEAVDSTLTAPVSGGAVSREALNGAQRVNFFYTDPATDEDAREVKQLRPDSANYRLACGDVTVFVRATPAPPKFTHLTLASGTVCAFGTLALASDGECYRCIVSTAGDEPAMPPDAAFWVKVPLLEFLVEAVKKRAIYEWFTSEQEHAQAARYEALADNLLKSWLERKGHSTSSVFGLDPATAGTGSTAGKRQP
jgi:hypothetical protein